jgi:hypothetical protein
MKTLSLKFPARLPRALLLLAALLLPQMVLAGYFYLPSSPVPNVSYPITWYGTASGSYALIHTQAPGETIWRTFGSGGVGQPYGQCTISSAYNFTMEGTWLIKVTSGTTGSPVVDTTSIYISNANNQAPVPAITIDGRSPNDSVAQGTTVTVRYKATDVNRNLSGIRYNVWNPASSYFDNGGGGFVSQSGNTGEVTHSVTLSSTGDWYFWTDAQDSLNASASTGAWYSGFKLTVTAGTTYSTPSYEPWYWNDGGTVQGWNNCYNYANNRRTDTFAQPGRASGNQYAFIDATEISDGAISDGLEPTNATATSPSGKTKIALVIWPGYDYHWYRKDSNGLWTHKPGQTQATNLDNSGNAITNPETADRGGYTQFVGYFFTPSDSVQGNGHANIN